MDKLEEYRLYAEEAQKRADRAQSPEQKAAWLELARGWVCLLPREARARPQEG